MNVFHVGEHEPPQAFVDQQSNCGDLWLVTDYLTWDDLHAGTAVSCDGETLFIFEFSHGFEPVSFFGLKGWDCERKFHTEKLVAKVDELVKQTCRG